MRLVVTLASSLSFQAAVSSQWLKPSAGCMLFLGCQLYAPTAGDWGGLLCSHLSRGFSSEALS